MTDETKNLKKTPLYSVHQRSDAKLIEFGGWHMPVQYKGIIEEHKAVRKAAGLFDLSHMGEFEVSGSNALKFLQYATTNDVSKLEVGQAHYTMLCYPDGGIVDDLIIYRLPDKYFLVVNASNIEKDFHWLNESMLITGGDILLRDVSYNNALISIQGPKSVEILQPLVDVSLGEMQYYHCVKGKVAEIPALIARTGYTGEDGFELFIQRKEAEKVWDTVFEAGKDQGLLPIGLGARDTLRLEAKMALYGNDLDATINPLEASLSRFVKFDKGDFVGRISLEEKQKAGLKRKLIGFEMIERGIARHGYKIEKDGKNIGVVTSGAPSPTLGKNIGLALVQPDYASIGTEFQVIVRDQPVKAVVVKTPFYTKKK